MLLASAHYDPAASVSKTAAALLAMTALDTTNLRLAFTVPANGAVLVRLRGVVHGATTYPQVVLGVLEGSTVKGRQSPMGALKNTALATAQLTLQAMFVVPGLTPAASLTWDAAYGVATPIASTGIKYGGPDDTTTDNAFGGFAFEIYDTPTLLGAVLYDPSTAVVKAASSLRAITAVDTTNARITFTAPASGTVFVRIRACQLGTDSGLLFGVLDGATVKGRQSAMGGMPGTALTTTKPGQEASFLVTGLTPSTSYTWDAAWGVEITSATGGGWRYGGTGNFTNNVEFGAFGFEVWAV